MVRSQYKGIKFRKWMHYMHNITANKKRLEVGRNRGQRLLNRLEEKGVVLGDFLNIFDEWYEDQTSRKPSIVSHLEITPIPDEGNTTEEIKVYPPPSNEEHKEQEEESESDDDDIIELIESDETSSNTGVIIALSVISVIGIGVITYSLVKKEEHTNNKENDSSKTRTNRLLQTSTRRESQGPALANPFA